MNRHTRRGLLAIAALAPVAALSGCAFWNSIWNGTPVTNYNSQISALFTAGDIFLQSVTALVTTGAIPKATAAGWAHAVTTMASYFQTLDADVDSGATISATLLDEATNALLGAQKLAVPAVVGLSPQQAQAATAHAKEKLSLSIAAIIAWVTANLSTLMSAGTAIYNLVESLISELSPTTSVTTPQVDAAYQSFSGSLSAFLAAVA